MPRSVIFIVDDDALYAGTVKKLLHHKKYKNVQVFSNGEDCAENLSKKPGLVILDFSLETLNGLDVLRLIKSKQPKTKVVILTSLNEDPKLQEKCMEEGALGFFSKDPTGVNELISWIDKNIGRGFFSF